MKRRLGPTVGVRKLHEAGSPRKIVVVTLARPRKATNGDWVCPYQIRGLATGRIQYAHGVDAVQALLLAFEGIRTQLSRTKKRLSWEGGEPGDTGFTRFVPTFFGLEFSKRLDQMIAREVDRFARKAKSVKRRTL